MPITRAYEQASQPGNFFVAGKNKIINGDFNIWQRGTSIVNSSATNVYTADRWFIYSGTSNKTVSRQTTGDTTNLPNIQYCARVQRNNTSSNTDIIYFAQSLETSDSIPFVGRTVTLSFYARAGSNFSSASNALTAAINTGTGVDQNNITSYTGLATPASNAFTLTTTWQRFSVSGTIATSATEIGIRIYYTPSGTAGANDFFEITGVQLEVGAVATPFTTATGTLAGELAACQRYYYRITEFQIAGGTQSAAENKVFFALNSFNGVPMRTTPTAAFESTPYVTNGSSNLRTVTAVAVASKAMIGFTYDSTRLTDSYSYMINAADAGRAVSLSAEL